MPPEIELEPSAPRAVELQFALAQMYFDVQPVDSRRKPEWQFGRGPQPLPRAVFDRNVFPFCTDPCGQLSA